MKTVKKLITILLGALLAFGVCSFAAGCGNKSLDAITVITREEGSGTRGAFVELTGVEAKDENGIKVDRTTKKAEVAQQTAVVIKNVSNNKRAIGYISFGSLNDSVKAVSFEGVAASVDNIKNGSYKLSRPFNVAYKENNDNATLADFLKYLRSAQAATVINGNDYIAPDTGVQYEKPATAPNEELVINGSSSVHPLMQKLVEAYIAASGVSSSAIRLEFNDSSSGMTGTMNGTYDLGMASRDLKTAEAEVLASYVLATDGIAVIVNKNNPVESFTKAQVCDIYTGAVTKWSELGVTIA